MLLGVYFVSKIIKILSRKIYYDQSEKKEYS